MNGRVYDYNLGRFLSVDPLIQSPTSTQSVNPYSYVMNNPLAGTDPTGYCAAATGSHICSNVKATTTQDGGTLKIHLTGGTRKQQQAVVKAIANGATAAQYVFPKMKQSTADIGGQSELGQKSAVGKTDLRSALKIARDEVAKTKSVLGGDDKSSRNELLYQWYGSTDSDLVSELRTRLINVDNILHEWQQHPGRITVDGSKDFFGEVTSEDKDHKVTLGSKFIRASVSGMDSRSSTFIHEASHFNIYGKNGAIRLEGTIDVTPNINALARQARLESRTMYGGNTYQSRARVNSYTFEAVAIRLPLHGL